MDSMDFLTIDWFSEATLRGFEWENPLFLYGIPFIPLLFILRWLFQIRNRSRLDVALQEDKIKRDWFSLLRFVPDIIFAIFMSLLLVALARPQKVNEQVDQWTEGIDIMLILDTSGSMEFEDFKPNRLESAKNVAKEFIKGRFRDRIGVVVFAGDAYSLAPLTTDYELLNKMIDDIKIGMIPKDGTAIGSALGVGVNRMQSSDAKSKVIILLSDGDNNAGNIDPITAAELAYGFGIKTYTIGIGKEGMVPITQEVTDFFGRKREVTQQVESHLDETTLRKIADIGEGKFFRASNNSALEEIFSIIDEYEKVEIKESRYKDTKDYYYPYLKWAIVFFLLWMLTKITFLNNFLED